MDPLLGGLISGGFGLLSGMMSSDTSAQNSQIAAQTSAANNAAQIQAQEQMLNQTEGFNAEQAQESRDFSAGQVSQAEDFSKASVQEQERFEEGMSNSAYQRAAADMKAAGLNPMIMAGSGGPSSTPSVAAPSGVTGSSASASIGTPSVPQAQFAPRQVANPLAGLGDAVSKAVNSAVQFKQMDKMTDEIANLQTERAFIGARTATEAQNENLRRAQFLHERDKDVLTQLAQPSAMFSARQAEDLNALPDWARNAATVGSFVGKSASDVLAPLASTARSVRQFLPSRSTSETTDSATGNSRFTERWNDLYN